MKFTREFTGCEAGKVYPTTFAKGDECPPELEEAALDAGALKAKEPKAQKPNGAKPAGKGQGGAGDPGQAS